MNATVKNILTNPITIGSAILSVGIAAGAFIWGKKRPKTDAEIELLKIKEINAETERQRQHELSIQRIKAKQALDEIEAQEKTKREAKAQEERTHQIDLEIQKLKEKREWEKNAPAGYWELEIAKANAAKEQAAVNKEHDTQREIARLQAEAARYSAEANARAAKEREYYGYKRQESADSANSANVQAIANGIAQMVTGKVNS